MNYKLIISIAIPLLVGFLGSFATSSSVDSWYAKLEKPFFNPPNWIFAPVWTILYIMMGISLYLVWDKGSKIAITLFIVQLALNLLWSFIFFGMQQPFIAFIEIVLLWIAIMLAIFYFYPVSAIAAYLMIPYVLWVSFAAVLNFFIYWLN